MAKYWNKVGRWSSWLLTVVLILEFISGYGILHFRIFGVIIGKANAFKLHTTIQPVAVFFVLAHVLPYLRRLILRFNIERTYIVDSILILLFAALFAGSMYIFFI